MKSLFSLFFISLMLICTMCRFPIAEEQEDSDSKSPPPIYHCKAVSRISEGYGISPYKSTAKIGALHLCANNTALHYEDVRDLCVIDWCKQVKIGE